MSLVGYDYAPNLRINGKDPRSLTAVFFCHKRNQKGVFFGSKQDTAGTKSRTRDNHKILSDGQVYVSFFADIFQ
jgi:hypothetical protein